MSDTNGGPPPVQEPSDRVLRIAWPYNPRFFGFAILTTEEEIREKIGADTPEPALAEFCRHVREDGMRLLVIEAEPDDQRTFCAMLERAIEPATPGGQS